MAEIPDSLMFTGVATNDLVVARVNPNVDFQLEAGMTASVHKFAGRAGTELTAKVQSLLPDRKRYL
jgi:hypothetical protein